MAADLAGWTAANFDATKIQVANTHLNRSLVDKIYYAADVPTTWEKYQEAAIKIDHNWRLRQGSQLHLFHRPSYQVQPRQREDVPMEVDRYQSRVVSTSTASPPTTSTYAPNQPRFAKITDKEREELRRIGGCFFCRQP